MTHILFVCTGNICRSPMAEVLMRREIASRGLNGVTVSSAGTGAWDGAPASEGAYLVGLEHGLDLSGHRARLLTDDLVKQADHILAMAEHHLTRLRELRAGPKAMLLGTFAGWPEGEGEVGDPFGGDIETYRQAFDDLDELVRVAAGRLGEAGGG